MFIYALFLTKSSVLSRNQWVLCLNIHLSYILVSHFGVKDKFLGVIFHFTFIMAENLRFGSFLRPKSNLIVDLLWQNILFLDGYLPCCSTKKE